MTKVNKEYFTSIALSFEKFQDIFSDELGQFFNDKLIIKSQNLDNSLNSNEQSFYVNWISFRNLFYDMVVNSKLSYFN